MTADVYSVREITRRLRALIRLTRAERALADLVLLRCICRTDDDRRRARRVR